MNSALTPTSELSCFDPLPYSTPATWVSFLFPQLINYAPGPLYLRYPLPRDVLSHLLQVFVPCHFNEAISYHPVNSLFSSLDPVLFLQLTTFTFQFTTLFCLFIPLPGM